jgi:malonate-semialdehyde dehydrogenase (acetylating)/methylmalonate-semialdehyde dehydrogenase
MGPTIFDHVDPSMRLYHEEIFGPVLACARVPDLDAALRLVNESEYGNGAVCFTRDGATAAAFEHRALAGMLGINVAVPVPVAWVGFGGWKASLFGDLHAYGPDAVRFYTRQQSVMQRWSGRAPTKEMAMPTTK